jgi:hypothetical protein
VEEVKRYAKRVGITEFPVLADGGGKYASVTPMTQKRHPELCAVGPDMRIISCTAGHKSYKKLMEDIRGDIAKSQSKPATTKPATTKRVNAP